MAQGNTQTLRTTNTYAMAVTALMTAVTCILAPLSIPIGPVPISLTNFAIYLSLYLLDWKKGCSTRSTPTACSTSPRHRQLYPLSSSRTCGTSCIFRIHRRNRKACRTNWRIYHWFHPNGNHCRYCN